MEQSKNEMEKQVQELIEQTYQTGYKAGVESCVDSLTADSEKYIEQGRNEAWKAARKIAQMSPDKLESIFNKFCLHNIMGIYSVSEAIEKIRAYEEQKKQEDEEIKVGDEVIYRHSELTGIVTSIYKTKKFDILWNDGSVGQEKNISDFKKTGRTFPEIVEVLKKMQEE